MFLLQAYTHFPYVWFKIFKNQINSSILVHINRVGWARWRMLGMVVGASPLLKTELHL